MDLISTLASTVGIDKTQAQALAGSVLGSVQSAVAEEAGEGTAAQLGEAVPELGGWKAQAAKLLGDKPAAAPAAGGLGGLGGLLGGLAGGGAGGLLGAAAGALGGQAAKDTAAIVTILGRFDIDAGKAALVAPVILDFLKSRLDPGLLSKVLAAAPALMGAGGGDGLTGALTGFLGR
ncbi:MAG: hypothetical protein H6739_24785 [Alphaproteobacteria bacterium]|nr:hypothetical protein [Alphaproteobacteria bacterium]